MSAFWTLFWITFWLTFLATPILFALSRTFIGTGSTKSTSHFWASVTSGAKLRDATVQDVWKHYNPGKSWYQHQTNMANLFLVVMFIFLVVLLPVFTSKLIPVSERDAQRGLTLIGGSALAVILSGTFFAAQRALLDSDRRKIRIVHVSFLVISGLGILAFILLNLVWRIKFPISPHWLWVPIVISVALPVTANWIAKDKRKKSRTEGSKLEGWFFLVAMHMETNKLYDIKLDFGYGGTGVTYKGKKFPSLEDLLALLTQGKFDDLIQEGYFFEGTEEVLLSCISGKPMAISNQMVYSSSKELIRAAQAFYFYGVKKFNHKLHPRIEKAMSKA